MIQRADPSERGGGFSLLDETADQTGDPIYTTAEVERFHYTVLRNLAARAQSDEVNGKSNRLLIEKYFGRQRTLTDY